MLDLFLALLAGALYAAATVVPLVVLRVNERLVGYLVLSGANAVATTTLILVAVVGCTSASPAGSAPSAASNLVLLAAAAVVLPWYRHDGSTGSCCGARFDSD